MRSPWYNHHVVQRNLGHLTPVKALKGWYGKKPELFNKRVYDHMGLDIYPVYIRKAFTWKLIDGYLFPPFLSGGFFRNSSWMLGKQMLRMVAGLLVGRVDQINCPII